MHSDRGTNYKSKPTSFLDPNLSRLLSGLQVGKRLLLTGMLVPSKQNVKTLLSTCKLGTHLWSSSSLPSQDYFREQDSHSTFYGKDSEFLRHSGHYGLPPSFSVSHQQWLLQALRSLTHRTCSVSRNSVSSLFAHQTSSFS